MGRSTFCDGYPLMEDVDVDQGCFSSGRKWTKIISTYADRFLLNLICDTISNTQILGTE